MSTLFERVVASPIGPWRLVAANEGLVAVNYPGEPAQGGATEAGSHPVLDPAAAELAAYFEGRLRTFSVPLAARGTPFQQRVWAELVKIPYGETRTYAEIARALGNEGASRAVGGANSRSPLAIIVPCHRVIGAAGDLTGYAGGLETKRWLLRHERRVLGLAHAAAPRWSQLSLA